jgi:CspA family cold shock protein
MTTGTIVSLRDRGFGFVAPDGGPPNQDLFFHRSAVADDGFDRLREGERISFDQEADPRDPSRQRAVRVAPVADEDPA